MPRNWPFIIFQIYLFLDYYLHILGVNSSNHLLILNSMSERTPGSLRLGLVFVFQCVLRVRLVGNTFGLSFVVIALAVFVSAASVNSILLFSFFVLRLGLLKSVVQHFAEGMTQRMRLKEPDEWVVFRKTSEVFVDTFDLFLWILHRKLGRATKWSDVTFVQDVYLH